MVGISDEDALEGLPLLLTGKWKEGAAKRKRLFGPIQRNQRRSCREGVRDSGNDLQENGGHQ
jgi:hypothetical protein